MALPLRQLHQEISRSLQEADIEQPRREAALILSHFLGLPLAGIYANAGMAIEPDRAALVRDAGRRRAQHVPLAYLLGEIEFSGLTFKVGPGVLVPRADSEILVEKGLESCQRIPRRDRPLHILDICTGTGCIGISLTVRLRQTGRAARLWLTEIDPAAAGYAQANLVRHDLTAETVLAMTDLFPSDRSRRWDLILANPPYIVRPVIATLMPEVRCYEPLAALDGGPDGLDFYRRLIDGAADRLEPGGCLLVEHGYDQAGPVTELIAKNGQFELIPTVADYGGRPRVSGGWRR